MDNYLENNIKIDNIKFQKMLFLFNAIEEGWSIKKKNNSYVFSKNHEGKKEVFEDNYLDCFMKTNFDIKSIISQMINGLNKLTINFTDYINFCFSINIINIRIIIFVSMNFNCFRNKYARFIILGLLYYNMSKYL